MAAAEDNLDSRYDVTLITLKPGTQARALASLKDRLAGRSELCACWYSELGALNQIFIILKAGNAEASLASRLAEINSANPFGIGEFIAGMSMDTYASFDFIAPIEAGEYGPIYEVRTYLFKPGGVQPTIDLWRNSVPKRAEVSPLLAAMTSVTGALTRLIHIWPYKSLDERMRLRAKAVAEGVWPPPGGAAHFITQQSDIYLPFPFSPLR